MDAKLGMQAVGRASRKKQKREMQEKKFLRDVRELWQASKFGFHVSFDGVLVPNKLLKQMPMVLVVEWFDNCDSVWVAKQESEDE